MATRDSTVVDDAVESQIVPCFDRTINVEPLRHRPDDIRAMIPAMLRTLTEPRPAGLAAGRQPGPGTRGPATPPRRATCCAACSRPSAPAPSRLADLPPECMAVGRRTLTPLESLERDAITQALIDHGGNKGQAAEHLGMSRATIYRKIRGYNIDTRR